MHIHVLGICGTFMGGLAALAREAGHRVTGCDTGVYPPMSDQLRALGIELIEGFGSDQMALKPDMFVVGNVVSRARTPDGKPKFPLAESILDSGARYTSGPQWLAEHVLQGRHVLAVAGTHGKTTTTSMLAWILECAGKSPGFLIGGVPLVFGEEGGTSARLGGLANPRLGRNASAEKPCFVIEADEYDTAFFDKRSKFVHYGPRTAILNNLEFDHADIFDNLAAIERQFHHLVRVVPGQGRVVLNAQDDALARVLKMGCYSELVGFGGAGSGAEFTSDGPAHDFSVHSKLVPGLNARVKWALSGSHNQANALAAIAAAQHVGVHPQQAAQALCSFVNAKRRMELRGEVVLTSGKAPVHVYDDFAHHPTAIRVTIDGLRERLNADGKHAERIIAVFEPRSATMKLGTMAGQLPWALEHAHMSHCHAAGLSWNPAEPLKLLGTRAQTHMAIDAVVQAVVADARPGDHIVCMSNGGFGGIHQKLLDALTERAKP